MKVLLVCGIYTDGKINNNSQFVAHQAQALRKKGIDVTVLSFDVRSIRRKRPHGINKYVINDIPVYGGSFPCGPLGGGLKFIMRRVANSAFRRIVKETGMPDVIHGHFYYNTYAALKIANKNNIPIVTTEHFSGVLDVNINDKIKKDAKFVYENTGKVICVSEGLCKSIKNFYGGEVNVINNIVSSNFYYEQVEKNKDFTFVCTGNLQKLKRHDLTLSAFEKFIKDVPNSKLVIIGEGELKNELHDMAKKLGISEKVEFKGKLDNKNLLPIYSKSHCFVLPSDFETFGVAYIEAIAAGLPAISSGYARQNGIINEENGIAISENTTENVYNAMKYIYENYDSYDKQAMSEGIVKKYSEEKIGDEIICVYNEVIN